jgi:hypothetical protein
MHGTPRYKGAVHVHTLKRVPRYSRPPPSHRASPRANTEYRCRPSVTADSAASFAASAPLLQSR